ncbi:hypothetical protein [Actinoplanes derwentensis]|nr:hypothetical protein [Actinoplanes derwentensis]GID82899.1 hypothetical protein Ade03nite_18230 [Actinoplanes derwentensis]
MPDPFGSGREGALESPRPIVPTPAMMAGDLRGRRVLVGLPGYGWRGDLRADEKVIQGSRTYIPVMPEGEWYRAEAERTEVFAALVPVERVWVEELGFAGTSVPGAKVNQLVSLDEPPRRPPVSAVDADSLTGRRVTQALNDGEELRDLRAVTESYVSDDGAVTVRVAQELDWYRWGWSGKLPRTLEVPAHLIWVE